MPGYSYIAVDRNGKEKRGSLEADNPGKSPRFSRKMQE